MALRPSPSLVYTAFYDGIKHEVLKVTGGHKITLTYDLYSTPSHPDLKQTFPAIAFDPSTSDNFQTTLGGLLKNPEFLPEGGSLGFGLTQLYPLANDTELKGLTQYLKGDDAHISRACQEFQLKPALQMIYDAYDMYDGGVMVNEVVYQPHKTYIRAGLDFISYMIECLGGVRVNKDNLDPAEMDVGRRDWTSLISWISPFSEQNALCDDVMGSEASGSPCLITRVPPASDRT